MEDETDELLLADDELFDVDPEILPRRLLSDFSIYNSEARVLLIPHGPFGSQACLSTDRKRQSMPDLI